MRKSINRAAALFIGIATLLGTLNTVCAENTVYKEFYVSQRGSDTNSGTGTSPFKTIERAMEEVRKENMSMNGDIVVNIEGNTTYCLEDTLHFTAEDSGKNGHNVIYRGKDMPIVSGGVKISGFKPSDKYDGIWEADVGANAPEYMRELYVGGKKRYPASSNKTVSALDHYDDPLTDYKTDGMYMDKSQIGLYENAEDIELQWLVNWKYSTANVESIEPDYENPDRYIVRMQQSWWNVTGGSAVSAYGPNPSRPFTVSNAFELLDLPGEFYYNRKTQKVYYMPEKDEDMNNIEVIAPRLERVLDINGDGDRVENIIFEGIEFAHAAFNAPCIDGVFPVQAQSLTSARNLIRRMPAGIQIDRAKNIKFLKNYFFGFGAVGMALTNGVSDVLISGNAFSDIGDTSISNGWVHQNYRDAPPEGSTQLPPDGAVYNLVNGNLNGDIKVNSSYLGSEAYPIQVIAGGGEPYINPETMEPYTLTIANETMYTDGIWFGDANSNEKQWVSYDFQREYTIDKIRLTFDTKIIPPEDRDSFEVLLSNDEKFEEYDVVGTQTEAAGEYVDFVPQAKKYRYLMIRATEGNLGLKKVWALSSEVKPFKVVERNHDIEISNNYITRAGSVYCSGGGITSYYSERINILHNEITDIPYTGIMMGWGWLNTLKGSMKNNVSHNYIANVNTVMHDGGGIYTLSEMDGTIIEGNFVDGVFVGRGAYYTDNGSTHITLRDNISNDAYNAYFSWEPSIRENNYLSTYAMQPTLVDEGSDNVMEKITVYTPGNLPPKAYEIAINAGMEEEYRDIKNLVYEDDLRVIEKRQILQTYGAGYQQELITMLKLTIENTLENGLFGNLPGEYPYMYKYRFKKALESLNSTTAANVVETVMTVRSLVNEAAKNINRVSYEEMLEKCDGIDEANYSADSVDKFKSAVDKNRGAVGEVEKYEKLLALEDAMRTLESERYTSDIDFVYSENMTDCKIDYDKKLVSAYFPANDALEEKNVEILPRGIAKAGEKIINADLTKDVEIPMYNPKANKYDMWTLRAVRECGGNGWLTNREEKNCMSEDKDGNICLSPTMATYMHGDKQENGETKTLYFTPQAAAGNKKFEIIFGAGRAEGFEKDSTDFSNGHFSLAIDDKTAVLNYKIGGNVTKMKSIYVPMQYNKENKLDIYTENFAGGTQIKLDINGIRVINLITDVKFSGGYNGFYSPEFSIKVKNN